MAKSLAAEFRDSVKDPYPDPPPWGIPTAKHYYILKFKRVPPADQDKLLADDPRALVQHKKMHAQVERQIQFKEKLFAHFNARKLPPLPNEIGGPFPTHEELLARLGIEECFGNHATRWYIPWKHQQVIEWLKANKPDWAEEKKRGW